MVVGAQATGAEKPIESKGDPITEEGASEDMVDDEVAGLPAPTEL